MMWYFLFGFVFGVVLRHWLDTNSMDEAHDEMSRVEYEAEDTAATAWDTN